MLFIFLLFLINRNFIMYRVICLSVVHSHALNFKDSNDMVPDSRFPISSVDGKFVARHGRAELSS